MQVYSIEVHEQVNAIMVRAVYEQPEEVCVHPHFDPLMERDLLICKCPADRNRVRSLMTSIRISVRETRQTGPTRF